MANSLTIKGQRYSVGDTLKISLQIREEENKLRLQIFEGLLIAVSGREQNKMFTMRKIGADSIGVERIFPVESPIIVNVELKRAGQVRRGKLSYLRSRVGKQATKVNERRLNTAPQA